VTSTVLDHSRYVIEIACLHFSLYRYLLTFCIARGGSSDFDKVWILRPKKAKFQQFFSNFHSPD